ncbi:hemolymph lipopolysaccharide-binding protein-like [Bacillus rossius redtenbacheri]|uniref:hemolymph lipopolysaccharide-binding protein-like n=1 Tax=Bacillus rossius redtenbacheri TaxID=93214 RepID=UPI002FDE0416
MFLKLCSMSLWCQVTWMSFFLGNVLGSTTQCHSSTADTTSFSIVSRRNATGHWSTEVVLGQDPSLRVDDDCPWDINIEQRATRHDQGSETVTITTNVAAPPRVDVRGYTLLPGHGYYRVHRVPATWEQARQTCADEGAHLVVLNSDAEAAAVRGLIGGVHISGTSDDWYLHAGFHDQLQEGSYVTVLGGSLSRTGYTTWKRGEPNNDGNEDCGSINRSADLNDVSCTKRLYFVCEL